MHLIGLLVVLVRPHIGTDGGRQGVKGQPLQIVSPDRVTGDGQQLLVGIHGFHNAAQFSALHRAVAHDALVAGEMPHCHAMVVEQLLQHVPGKGLGIAAVHTGDQGPLLDGHGQIHHMGGIGPYALGLLILIGMEETLKIIPLLLQAAGPGEASSPPDGAHTANTGESASRTSAEMPSHGAYWRG